MPVLADTKTLLADNVITDVQAHEIERRAREIMVSVAINAVLSAGVIAATFGLIFYLANAFAVAGTGSLLLIAGLVVLYRGSDIYRMFGNAAALIGSGMLVGGTFFELVDKIPDQAGYICLALGLPVMAFAGRALLKGGLTARFVTGSIFLMGTALHLVGVGLILEHHEIAGFPMSLALFYGALVIAAAGWITNVRTVTALALIPFAQMLDTSTSYFHAVYAFYSPESTLSILQVTALIAICLTLRHRVSERTLPHLNILAVMGFVVMNLCALVGSLWGDVIGSHIWGPEAIGRRGFDDWEAYRAAVDLFELNAFSISSDVYSIAWAVALIAAIFAASHKGMRGLFNTAVTFLAIHGYTQAFESFSNEPLAYVIGGLLLIPLAWGMWRYNQRFNAA